MAQCALAAVVGGVLAAALRLALRSWIACLMGDVLLKSGMGGGAESPACFAAVAIWVLLICWVWCVAWRRFRRLLGADGCGRRVDSTLGRCRIVSVPECYARSRGLAGTDTGGTCAIIEHQPSTQTDA